MDEQQMMTSRMMYQDKREQYKTRKLNELYTIMDDPIKWKEFQDLLRVSNSGITNSSVKENLLSVMRKNDKSTKQRQRIQLIQRQSAASTMGGNLSMSSSSRNSITILAGCSIQQEPSKKYLVITL